MNREQLRIVSCTGNENTGNERNHLYIVETEEGIAVDFLTPEEFEREAEERGLPGRVAIESHAPCPACMAGQFGISLEELKGKIPKTQGSIEAYQEFVKNHG